MTGLRASFWKRGDAAGRLAEAFPDLQRPCVREGKERPARLAIGMQNFYIMIYYLIHYIISRKTLSTVCVWKYKCYFTGGDNHPIFPNTKFQEPFSVLKQCSRKFLRELLIYCFHACFLSHALEFKIFCTVAVWPQCHSNSFVGWVRLGAFVHV